jgi:hypothetical protein
MNATYFVEDAAAAPPTFSAPPDAAPLRVVGIHHSCCREILRLKSENHRLHTELERIQASHDDLTKSAEIWIRLYETYLDLATRRAGAATCQS